MSPAAQSLIRPIEEKLKIWTLARGLWSAAGQPRGRLRDFWAMAEKRLAEEGDSAIESLHPHSSAGPSAH
jgi:hypothetical protein